MDSAGNLYGTSFQGGSDDASCAPQGCGLIYQLSHGSMGWSEKVLHAFNGYGDGPLSPLAIDPSGNLYGATLPAHTNRGLVFEITP